MFKMATKKQMEKAKIIAELPTFTKLEIDVSDWANEVIISETWFRTDYLRKNVKYYQIKDNTYCVFIEKELWRMNKENFDKLMEVLI